MAESPSPHATPSAHPARDLIIPFAWTGGAPDEAPPLVPTDVALNHLAQLPHLQRLLVRARHRTRFTGPLDSRTPPHEWALAWALGHGPHAATPGHDDRADPPARLPVGATLPWAAWQAAGRLPSPDTPAAWFMPAHQEVGMDHVSLHHPDALDLDDTTSQRLMAALAPLALEDGIELQWVSAQRWLATGEVFRHLSLASPDRVASPSGERSIAPWMNDLLPSLKRLQTEAQMLFYTHPAHDERQSRRLPPVNSLWIAGCGAAAGPLRASVVDPASVQVVNTLRTAALGGDAAGWLQAWTALDAEVLPAWVERLDATTPSHPTPPTVSLCGERGWLRLSTPPRGTWERLTQGISNIFGINRFHDELKQL